MPEPTPRSGRVFAYVVVSDTGFAPNPFHRWCTLACCKPRIRRHARPGDLVVGLSSRCESVVYILEVQEKLTFDRYWNDSRFCAKRPDWKSRRLVERCGDSIYEPDGGGGFAQQRSQHWDHVRDQENVRSKRRDTSADAVLASRNFVYFGGDGPVLPDELDFLHVARGHRSRFTQEQISKVREFFDALPRGIQGRPRRWSEQDTSWRPSCGSS